MGEMGIASSRGAASGRRLKFDVLEDRLLLTVSPPLDPDYAAWRDHIITLDDEQPIDNTEVFAQDAQSGPLIGLPAVTQNFPYTGAGYTVAVIDSGIDYNHTALGGGWGNRVIGGYDFVNHDANPMDDNGHGTHVAGIVGSSNGSYAGVAQGVNFVALKVLNASGAGTFGAVEDALDWVLDHRLQYNIVAVNLSIGVDNLTTSKLPYLQDEFDALKAAGVFTAASAGNEFYTYGSTPGLADPAVDPAVVSVGATWDANVGSVTWASGAIDYTSAPDRIISYSQRSSALDIVAPGANITSTWLNNQSATRSGTSMSAPVIAGAAVLIRQMMDSLGRTPSVPMQDAILKIMQDTGKTVIDGDDENDNVVNTGLAFKRIDIAAALMSQSITSVTGTAFDDRDQDKTQDPNEPGLVGWKVYIDANNNQKFDTGERFTATDANGNYQFMNVSPGVASIRLSNQLGWSMTLGNAGQKVTVVNGPTPVTANFGSYRNYAPTIGTIADLSVTANQLLSFTVPAADVNTQQTLTYSLAGAIPAGVAINAATGLFTWTPTNAQAGDYTFTFVVADNGNPSLNATATFKVSVLPLLATVSSPVITEGNSGQLLATFTVTLAQSSSVPQMFTYGTQDGTATAGRDYRGISGMLVFNPGETTKTIQVAILGDTIDEYDETFVMRLWSMNTPILPSMWGTATIADNDAAPTLTVKPIFVKEENAGTAPASFALTLSAASEKTIRVDYSTVAGTATADVDFTPVSGTIVFNPGETKKNVDTTVNNDTMYEVNETFFLRLTNPVDVTPPAADAQATIVNDDIVPALSISDATVVEGNSGKSYLSFVATLSNPTYQSASVSYKTVDGAAKAGVDYVAANTKLTFDPGETIKTIVIEVNGDATVEAATKTLTLSLSGVKNATLATTTVTGTIKDDDGPNAPVAGASALYAASVDSAKDAVVALYSHPAAMESSPWSSNLYALLSDAAAFSSTPAANRLRIILIDEMLTSLKDLRSQTARDAAIATFLS